MKRFFTSILALVFATAILVPVKVSALEQINELNITSPVTDIFAGPLNPFTVSTTTEHITIEDYGSNTGWSHWPEGYASWHGFGTEDPTAVADNTTLYALRLAIHADSNYEIAENPTIIYNGNNFTTTGSTEFDKMDWGGYLYVDLGHARIESEDEDPIFTLTFDFGDGALYDGQSIYTKRTAGFGPILNEPFLISCIDYSSELDECHSLDVKKGKELSYVTVNGERHEYNQDDGFILNQDTTIRYFWTDKELANYTIEDEQGNSISFSEEVDREFHLNINSFSFSMTDEELEVMGVSREEYEEGKAAISAAVEEYGPVIAYFEIEVFEIPQCGDGPCMCEVEDGEVPCENDVHEGPFEIKIKYTEDMGDFKTFKLINVNMDENGITTEESATLTLVDGYLVGTLEHLSGYALIGSNETPGAPDTGKSITNTSASLSLIALIGTLTIAGIAVVLKKI